VDRIPDRFSIAKPAENSVRSVREVRQQLMSLYKDQAFTQAELRVSIFSEV
jgi:hypothetical protein